MRWPICLAVLTLALIIADWLPQGAAEPPAGPVPTEPVSFAHCRATDTWHKYAGRLSFGRGQTLALVDDGCDMAMPEWQSRMGDVPKVRATYDSIQQDADPRHEGKGYHGSTIGVPSSLNFGGKQGVAFNDQVVIVRAVECCHCSADEDATLAAGLQWVADHHEEFKIKAVNLAPVDDLEHPEPLPGAINAQLKRLRELGIWVSAPCGNHDFSRGISWPACQTDCFAIGAVKPDKDEAYLDRHAKTELLVPAAATSSSNAIACGAALILMEAIEVNHYDWSKDGPNLPQAMMAIFQRSGKPVLDPATGITFRRLDLLAAVDLVFAAGSPESGGR